MKPPPGVPADRPPPTSPPPADAKQEDSAGKLTATSVFGQSQNIQQGASPDGQELVVATSPAGSPDHERSPPGAPKGRKPPASPPPGYTVKSPTSPGSPTLSATGRPSPPGSPPPPLAQPVVTSPGTEISLASKEPTSDSEDEAEKKDVHIIEVPESTGPLLPGRLSVKCISAEAVWKAGSTPQRPTKVDACIKAILGDAKQSVIRRSVTHRNCGNSPNFKEEVLTFDLTDPTVFLSSEGSGLPLTFELMDDGAWGEELLGHITLNVQRFLAPTAVGKWSKETVPLTPEINNTIGLAPIVYLEIMYEVSLVGMLVVTVEEGRGLAMGNNTASSDRTHPYVALEMGDEYRKRSLSVQDGGSNPNWRGEEIVLWIDRSNWVKDLTFKCMREDPGIHKCIGTRTMSVLPFMRTRSDIGADVVVELDSEGDEDRGKEGQGQLMVHITFLPAGSLTVRCDSGRGLKKTGGVGAAAGARQDPYVVLSAEGQAASLTRRTQVDKDGGSEPNWGGEILNLDIVDHYILHIEVINHDIMGRDEPMGVIDYSLLQVFMRGSIEEWVPLKTSTDPNSGPAGEVKLAFHFEGPTGIAYPQYRPGIDSFDDSRRTQAQHASEEGEAEKKEVVACEFTDDEIKSAFKFLDLDKNNFIGAAEIRHILICMGELITDDEIDTMITMVDSDGDGQVSYEEFHALVTDPNLGEEGGTAGPQGNKQNEAAMVQESLEHQRMVLEKKTLLEEFVRETELALGEVEIIVERLRTLNGGRGAKSVVDFDTWIDLIGTESTGQYRKLFKLYSVAPVGEPDAIDIREFLLGAFNFIEMDKSKRMRFIFDMYDEDRSGFLSMAELIEVLKANHMQTAKAVIKKANTIMRQVDSDGSGTLSYDEFVVMCKKFPNLCFPPANKATAGGG